MQSPERIPQWTIEHGYIIAPEFGYDISFERLNDPHLLEHMAAKEWCDIYQLSDVIREVTLGFNTGEDNGRIG